MWEKDKYNEEILDDMLIMTAENYGENEHIANREFIYHEYFENPSGDPIIGLGYDKEKKILAGQYVVIAQRVFVVNQQINAILSLNTLTRKAYRGQGVFIGLAEDVYRRSTEQGVYFCYGAPNQNSHHGFIAKLKFVDIGIMPLYLKIVNPIRLIAQKIGIQKNMHISNYIKGENNITAITTSNVFLLQNFWEEIRGKYPVMVVRDAEYFKWRYLESPLRNYDIYAYVDHGKVVGYIVTRITIVANMQCGMIVDFLFQKEASSIGMSLLQYATTCLKASGISLMGCLMQKHCEEAFCLRKSGFFKCPKKLEPQPFPIIFRKFRNVPSEVENFQNWFFTMGDYDVI